MYSYGSPHMAAQKQDDQLERTFSSYVRIQVVVLKTYLGRWTIGRSGERGSGISVLPARYDDDDDDISYDIWIEFYIGMLSTLIKNHVLKLLFCENWVISFWHMSFFLSKFIILIVILRNFEFIWGLCP